MRISKKETDAKYAVTIGEKVLQRIYNIFAL